MNIIEMKKRQTGQGGFTLIELLVVIAILAVLAGLAVIGIGAMRDNADKTACKADRDTVATAAEAWLLDDDVNTGTLSVGQLVSDKYLKTQPKSKYGITVTETSGVVSTASTFTGC